MAEEGVLQMAPRQRGPGSPGGWAYQQEAVAGCTGWWSTPLSATASRGNQRGLLKNTLTGVVVVILQEQELYDLCELNVILLTATGRF